MDLAGVLHPSADRRIPIDHRPARLGFYGGLRLPTVSGGGASAPTERLYYTDAYSTEFSARVIDRADDGRRVYLDRTFFYPTSGGQQFDLGALGGAKVVDVIDEGERIAHVIEGVVSGETVNG